MKYYRIKEEIGCNIDPCKTQWLNNNLFTTYEKALLWLKEYQNILIKTRLKNNCFFDETDIFFVEDKLIDNTSWEFWRHYIIEEFTIPKYNII